MATASAAGIGARLPVWGSVCQALQLMAARVGREAWGSRKNCDLESSARVMPRDLPASLVCRYTLAGTIQRPSSCRARPAPIPFIDWRRAPESAVIVALHWRPECSLEL